MTDIISLKAKIRKETGKKVNTLRSAGQVPAVLYGHKIKSINLAIDYLTFEKVFKKAGESTLIDLTIDDQKPVKVLVQDYQLHPTTNQFIHVDFHQIKMDEKLHAAVEIKFIGEAPAVKEIGGVLITSLNTLEVECLPQDLVHEIEVDLSNLKAFDDAIHVSDIKVPEGIVIKNVAEDVIVLIQAPRTEKEMEDLETKIEEPAEGEGEEPAEGEGEAKPAEGAEAKPESDGKPEKKPAKGGSASGGK